MPRKIRTPLTDEQRQLKREAELKLLTDAVAELKTSEGWTRWLRVRKAFHRYSLNNQLLIALQKPEATRVAGFKKWLALGYCVRKGEKGLKIFAPVPPSKQKLEEWRRSGADPKTRPRTFFRLTSVFDVSQVDPLPAPAEPVDLEPVVWRDVDGDELAELLEDGGALWVLAAAIGVSFELRHREGEGRGAAAGFYRPSTQEIVVYTDAAPNGQAATAVHELAHALVRLNRQDSDPELDYAGEELVVESVAYTVLSTLGIDAGASSVPYLASWSEQAPIATIEAHAKMIDRLASRIELGLQAEREDEAAEGTSGVVAEADASTAAAQPVVA